MEDESSYHPRVIQAEAPEEEPGLFDALLCRPRTCCRTECLEPEESRTCCEVREGEVPCSFPAAPCQWTTYAEEVGEAPPRTIPPELAPPLYVPQVFDKLRLVDVLGQEEGTVVDCSPGAEERQAREEEQRRILQTVVRAFVRMMLRGVLLSLVLDDGSLLPAVCSLDRRLELLEIQVCGGEQVNLPFRDIGMVCTQEDMAAVRGAIPGGAFLDASCVALVLSGRRFLAFRFENPRAREYFEVSLGVLVAGRGTPRERDPQVPAELPPLAARLLSSSAGGLPTKC